MSVGRSCDLAWTTWNDPGKLNRARPMSSTRRFLHMVCDLRSKCDPPEACFAARPIFHKSLLDSFSPGKVRSLGEGSRGKKTRKIHKCEDAECRATPHTACRSRGGNSFEYTYPVGGIILPQGNLYESAPSRPTSFLPLLDSWIL